MTRAELGLPALPPGLVGADDAAWFSLLSGCCPPTTHCGSGGGGPDRFRLALQGTLTESDLVLDRPGVWLWASRDNAVTHLSLPAAAANPAAAPAEADRP